MPSIRIEPSPRKVGAKPRTRGPSSSATRDGFLGLVGAAAVEPLVEVQVVRLLGHGDFRQAGRGEQVDDLTPGEAPRVRAVAGALQAFVMAGPRGIGIGEMIANDEHSSGSQQPGLARHEGSGLDHMVRAHSARSLRRTARVVPGTGRRPRLARRSPGRRTPRTGCALARSSRARGPRRRRAGPTPARLRRPVPARSRRRGPGRRAAGPTPAPAAPGPPGRSAPAPARTSAPANRTRGRALDRGRSSRGVPLFVLAGRGGVGRVDRLAADHRPQHLRRRQVILGAGERIAVDQDQVGELARLDRALLRLLGVEAGVVDRVERDGLARESR